MHQALVVHILPISHAKQQNAIQTNLRIAKSMLAPPLILTYLSTQQHVNITAAASYVYVPNVFDIHMIS